VDHSHPRELFYDASRFEQIHSVLRCPRNLLSERLERLVGDGIVGRTSYREPGQRSRPAYRLTDRGRDLFPILLALTHWGDHYLADDAPPVIAEHGECGGTLRTALECDRCQGPVSVDEVKICPGPAAL